MIDPVKLASKRRASVFKEGKLLLSNFEGTEQQKDINSTKGHVQGALDQFYRVKTNVKDEPMQEFYKAGDKKLLMFDFNWWPLTRMLGKQEDFNDVFIYQLKGCNVLCNFCFVDYFNNNGQLDNGAAFFPVGEIVDTFVKKRDELKKEGKNVNVLRASGGEPSLVPEQWLSLLVEIDGRGLSKEVYIQSDTNLTTGTAIDQWMASGSLDKNILEKIAEFDNFGLLSCFKGTDPEGFSEITRCDPKFFDETFYSFKKLADAGIAIYPHVINPNPKTLESFMERFSGMVGDQTHSLMHVFNIGPYGPVKARLEAEGKKRNDPKYFENKVQEWKDNGKAGEEILDRLVRERIGVGYKYSSRPLMVERLYRKKR